jgi:uncharacterized membrane protein
VGGAPSRLTRVVRTLALGAGTSASLALAGWMFASHKAMPDFVRRNAVGETARRFAFLDVGIALGVFLVVFVTVSIWRGLDAGERLVRRATPLAALGFVPLLFDHRLWDDWAMVFLTLAASFGFVVCAATRVSLETPAAFPRLRALRARATDRIAPLFRRARRAIGRIDLPLMLTIAGAIVYAAYFSAITIEHHRNLGTASFDLGLEDNLMWNLSHWKTPLFRSTPFDGPVGTHLRNHATFFSFLLVPVYRLAPGPETLLVIQAVLLGAAAVPLHLFARRRLPVWLATIVGFVYLLYPPLHGANLYDFHYLPLGVVFLWIALYAVESRRWALAVVAAFVAMSVREDVAFCLGVLGVLLLITDRAPRFGLGLAVAAGAYFLTMKLAVMPHFGIGHGEESFVHQYDGFVPPGGKESFGAILETILGNPGFTANAVLDRDKLQYVLLLLVPVLFLPVTRPLAALLVVPGFFFTLLSTGYSPLYNISFQYTSYWTAFLFIGLVMALERAAPGRRVPLAAGVLASTLACSYLFGAFFQHETLRGGFDRYVVGTTAAELELRGKLASVTAHLPPDGKVAASEFVLPHVSTRETAYTLRFGIYDADWLLFQTPLWQEERGRTVDALASGAFGVVDDEGTFVLAQRGAQPAANAAVLARIR